MTGKSFCNRAEIEQGQLASLQALLRTIAGGNPFYQRKLQLSEGASFAIHSLADFTARVPFTVKSELALNQAEFSPDGTNLSFPLREYCQYHQTSGTTGKPLRWLDTAQSWQKLADCWKEVYLAAGVSNEDAVFFAFSFGPFIGFWMAFDAAQQLGALCIPAGGMSSLARLQMLIDSQATVLCCTPTYAIHLAEVASKENLDLSRSKIRKIIVAGEAGGSLPSTRAQIERLWNGAKIFDHHGMTETGPVTFECPAEPCVLHVIERGYLAEIVEPEGGEPVKPGEPGELILTTLLRDGSPLLRYRTGDLVQARLNEPNSPCACGRHELALKGGILGRCDDMVVIRGVNVYPTAIEQIVRQFAAIQEYRVLVTNKGALPELRIEVELTPQEAEAPWDSALQKELHATLALRIPVQKVLPGSLPRPELKAKRWQVIS
ncbi:MAG: phenylacetate--CoA ligase family protein [Verrucomicrobiales bacterium]